MVEVSAPERPSAGGAGAGAGAGGGPRWRRADGVLWRDVRSGVLVLPAGADEPVLVSGTGVVVWELLARPASLEALSRSVASAQDVDPAAVVQPLATLLEQMRAFGLALAAE